MPTSPPLPALEESSATDLIFAVHDSLYALDALSVREILWLPEITPVEAMPPYVVGMVDRRGDLMPVLDLSVRLGRPAQRYRPQDSIIVLEGEQGTVGVIVQEVRHVGRLAVRDVGVGAAVAGDALPAVAGLATAGGEIVTLLNPSALWPGADDRVELTELAPSPADRYFSPQASPAERALFHERAVALRQPLATQERAGLSAVAVVVLNGEYFGIDLNLVREFAPVRQITPVPCCPPHVVGQMNLRGDILTLVDIRAVLQLPAASAAQVMVVQVDDLVAGVLVDAVLDVVYLQPAEIQPVPAAVQSLQDDYLRGTAPHGDKMLGLLDLDRILSRPDLVVYEEA